MIKNTKFIQALIIFLFLCIMLTCDAGMSGVNKLGQEIMLGQVYPSGNLYLKSFTSVKSAAANLSDADDLGGNTALRQSSSQVMGYCMEKDVCSDPAVNSAVIKFKRIGMINPVLSAETIRDGYTVESDLYLPAKEGMVGKADTECGASFKKNPAFNYVGDDFFRTVIDYCSFDDGDQIIHYQSTTPPIKNLSYQIFAVAYDVHLKNMHYFSEGIKRPLTNTEKIEVARQKADMAKQDLTDCTTNPSYLNDAKKILEADVENTPYQLRLSYYDQSGCGGHLALYYILDILNKGKLIQSYYMTHYLGPV